MRHTKACDMPRPQASGESVDAELDVAFNIGQVLDDGDDRGEHRHETGDESAHQRSAATQPSENARFICTAS